MKRPSFQFYPGDWLNDASLRMCSIGARGLWIDMICIMHQGSEYGYLKVGGKVILPANLARMCGVTLAEVEGWLEELESAGVYSVDDSGCIFSRRMIRDEEIRKARADGGYKGGNPLLTGKSKVAEKVNLNTNLQPTPSSSSSSSSFKESPNGDRQPSADHCPHEEILNLFAEQLPQLTQPLRSRWSGSKGAELLRTRWREDKRHQSKEFWAWYFGIVQRSKFHLGENERGWKADLPWLLKRENFDKMLAKGVQS